jgi:hypothetical protein
MRHFEKFNHVADTAIGAGMVAGPEAAKTTFEKTAQTMGGKLNFLPENPAIKQAVGNSLETVGSLAGVAGVGLIMYAGFKKLLSPEEEKK